MGLPKVMLNSEIPGVQSGQQPFAANKELSKSYMHFYQMANANDQKMYFAAASDYQQGTICGHWIVWQEQWVPVGEEVPVAFIFNKLNNLDPQQYSSLEDAQQRHIPIYGDLELGKFVLDKWLCYQYFVEYFALTTKIESSEKTVVEQIWQFFALMDKTYAQHDNMVVLKPVVGWEARGIHIISRENGQLRLRYLFGQPIDDPKLIEHILKLFGRMPYIIQAYVNTRSGIPEIGLKEVEFHDARFVFYIKEPNIAQFVQLYVKTPMGMIYYPVDKFPQQAFVVVEPVASKLAQMFPYGIFSVDVMRDASGEWFLTELNDQIGFNINWEHQDDIKNVSHLMQTFLDEMQRHEQRQIQ